jgi:uncharacterized protein (TIGR02284 family)
MADSKDVEALEALASTLTDSVTGYENAADDVTDPGIKNYLHVKAQERRAIVDEFRSHLRRLGGNADVGGSVSGSVHQTWLSLRSTFQDSTKAAVAEVERGEEYLKERFDKYLQGGELSPDTRSFLSDAYARAKFDNETWSGLAGSYR